MNKAYNRINWQNEPSDETPLNETNLNKIDVAADEIDNRVIALNTAKFDKSEAQGLFKDVSLDRSSGVITFTLYNGATKTIDTLLERIAINFDYDAATQRLVITLDDGAVKYVDMSALITQYEFLDTDTVAFSIDSTGKVSAIVKEGSIQERHLQPNYLANIKVEAAKAQASSQAAEKSESNASASEAKAQSYAVGGTSSRTGEDTDNAKYYMEQAKSTYEDFKKNNVTGIKGNTETSYRTGNVNITPEDIGAVSVEDFDNLQIGGRNLLYNSSLTNLESHKEQIGNWYLLKGHYINYDLFTEDGIHGVPTTTDDGFGEFVFRICDNEENSEYTLSCDVKSDCDGYTLFRPTLDNNTYDAWWQNGFSLNTKRVEVFKDKWVRANYTFSTTDLKNISMRLYVWYPSQGVNLSGLTVKNIKLEKGNKATDYSIAPEDMDSSISAVDARVTTLTETVSTQGTQLTDVQEQINSKIWQQDITTAVTGLQIGGRNLAEKTNQGITGWLWSLGVGGCTREEIIEDNIKCCKFVRDEVDATSWSYICYLNIGISKYLPNKKYTVSFEVKTSVVTSFNMSLRCHNGSGLITDVISTEATVLNTWTKLSVTLTTVAEFTSVGDQTLYINGMDSSPGVTYIFRNLKIEEGTKASSWTPASEDVDSSIAEVDSKLANHTHNYAGSSSAGGAANSAKLLMANNELKYGAYNGLQYFNQSTSETSGADANVNPANGWYHIIRMNHANSSGYFVDIATAFNSDAMYYRRISSGRESPWVRILDSNNYETYVQTQLNDLTVNIEQEDCLGTILAEQAGTYVNIPFYQSDYRQIIIYLYSSSSSGVVDQRTVLKSIITDGLEVELFNNYAISGNRIAACATFYPSENNIELNLYDSDFYVEIYGLITL